MTNIFSDMQTSSFRAPGKLMIAGEWGVLMPGSPCISAAVNKFVTARVTPADGFYVTAQTFESEPFSFSGTHVDMHDDLKFVRNALGVTLRFLKESGVEVEPFHLEIVSGLDNISANGEKVGFGSSAAVTVATVGAVREAYGLPEDPLQTYKIAALAHFSAQGKIGSGYDVATSSFKDVIRYVAPDKEWLTGAMNEMPSVSEVVSAEWPLLEARLIPFPEDLKIYVGYTGKGASTTEMVKRLYAVLDAGGASAAAAKEALEDIRVATELAVRSLSESDAEGFANALRTDREALQDLDTATGIGIETPELKTLAEIAERHGAVGKLSGAGGGDSGIAIATSPDQAEAIRADWEDAGIIPIDIR